ncbi:MAG: hypothetical protein ACTSPB_15360 [Candidatus Thorarchaeota archaeon]
MANKVSEYQGLRLKTLADHEVSFVGGTHKIGELFNTTYADLVDAFGQPSLYGSGDNKVQVTWVIEVQSEDGVETMEIYDWKTYDLDYTINSLSRWSIGGTSKNNPYILNAFVSNSQRKQNKLNNITPLVWN